MATARPSEAKRLYQEILDLSMIEEGPVALVFDVAETEPGVQKIWSVTPGELGIWTTPDGARVACLRT